MPSRAWWPRSRPPTLNSFYHWTPPIYIGIYKYTFHFNPKHTHTHIYRDTNSAVRRVCWDLDINDEQLWRSRDHWSLCVFVVAYALYAALYEKDIWHSIVRGMPQSLNTHTHTHPHTLGNFTQIATQGTTVTKVPLRDRTRRKRVLRVLSTRIEYAPM